MKFYIKMSFLPFVYLLFSAMLGLGIMLLDDHLFWLEFFLYATNTAFYVIIVSAAGLKDGQTALRCREQNDTFRRRIAETGEDLPLNITEEYTPWKGFVIGAIACIPTVLLVILHFVTNIGVATPDSTFGMGAGILSMVVFGFVFLTEKITFGQYAIALVLLPVVSCAYGIPYVIGAKKAQREYDKIRDIQKQLHGDGN